MLIVTLALTRLLGQSALSVVSIAMIGHWFARRIDRAMAVYGILLSVGFMLAFPLVGGLVQAWGWRRAWLVVGAALIVGLAPFAWLVARRSPEAIGLARDGDKASQAAGETEVALDGHSWRAAMATGAFWVFAIGTALYGLVASGIGLFNESIFAERGFGPDIYYQSLAVTAITGLGGNFLGGWLAERTPLTRLMALAMAVLAIGLAALPHLSSIAAVMTWAAGMGVGGGLVMVLFFSVWPRVYGRRHLGRIQGTAQALTVVASAIGPLLLAWCVDTTGSYAAMFRILAAIILAIAFIAAFVELPRPEAHAAPAPESASS
jgi:MFS family permease